MATPGGEIGKLQVDFKYIKLCFQIIEEHLTNTK